MLVREGRAIGGTGATLLCAVLILWLPLVPCANDEPGMGPRAFELTLAVQDDSGADSRSFAVGERVVLILTVRNRTDAAQTVSLSSSMTCDFSVAAPDGSELWRWSNGRRFAQVLTDLHFAPGESKRFTAEWNARAPSGGPAASGNYRASAKLAATGSEFASASTSFTLR